MVERGRGAVGFRELAELMGKGRTMALSQSTGPKAAYGL